MRTLFMLAGLALVGCGSPADETKKTAATTTQKAFAQRLPGVAGLENFARVNSQFYRGAQPTEEGFRHLKTMGVKTVVDFRSHHSTKKEVEAAGMAAVEIPLRADWDSVPPTDAELKRFFDIVLDPTKQPVYIHCAFGKDRTGTMAAVYRMEMDGWTADEALQEMESFGYHNYYKDFVTFIRGYKPHGYAQGINGK